MRSLRRSRIALTLAFAGVLADVVTGVVAGVVAGLAVTVVVSAASLVDGLYLLPGDWRANVDRRAVALAKSGGPRRRGQDAVMGL